MSFRHERVSELFIEEHISSDLHFHTVRVWFVDDPLNVGIGTAARNPADKYNAHKGYRLALKRALNDVLNAAERSERKPLRKWTAEEIENARLAKLEEDLTTLEESRAEQQMKKTLDQTHLKYRNG